MAQRQLAIVKITGQTNGESVRVEWTRMSGDEVEEVVAIMLLREHQRGYHVRPSKGDGGIDVAILPSEPRGGLTVYQVKKFASNLGANEKRQIKKSIERLQTWSKSSGKTVSRLLIALPLDPTPENLTWLQEIAKTVEFDLEWYGLAQVEGLVARYQDVIDYYINGGAGRLEAAATELTRLMRSTIRATTADETRPLSAIEARDHIVSVRRTVNSLDPFYRYDFSIGDHPELPAGEVPLDVVSAFSEELPDGSFATITIRSKFPDAPNWKEPTGSFRVQPVTDADRAAFEDFFLYGLPASFPAEFTLDLPGGMGVEAAHGVIEVGPTIGEPQRVLRWDTVDSAGTTLKRAVMDMSEATHGVRPGTGIAVTGTEQGGVFSSTWRMDLREQTLQIAIETHSLEGRPVCDIEPGVAFLATFGSPNKLRISPQFGPVGDALQDLPEPPPNQWVSIAQVVNDLVAIQSITNVTINFPSVDTLNGETQSEIRRFARLARGEIVEGTWGAREFTITLHDHRPAPDPNHLIEIRYAKDMVLKLDNQRIAIGAAIVEIPFAVCAAVRVGPDGERSVVLAPLPEKNRMRMQLGKPEGLATGEVFMRQVGSVLRMKES